MVSCALAVRSCSGTVGWVLATIDEMGLMNRGIPVATMPLGTGNDLARALKFGSGYNGTAMIKLLAQLSECGIVRMDRWRLDTTVRADRWHPLTNDHLREYIDREIRVTSNIYFSMCDMWNTSSLINLSFFTCIAVWFRLPTFWLLK